MTDRMHRRGAADLSSEFRTFSPRARLAWAAALACAQAAGAGAARAQPAGETGETGPAGAPGETGGAGRAKADALVGGVTVGGRVFVRETIAAVDGGGATGLLELESARVDVAYERDRVRAVAELEAAGGTARLRDAFLQLRVAPALAIRAGRFKVPSSRIETTSRWTLPTVDRGLLSDIYDDGLGVAGRRTGALASWRPAHRLRPRLEAGAFQSLGPTGDARAAGWDERYGLTGLVRGALEPLPGLALDAWVSSRLANDGAGGAPGREWAAGANAELDLDDRGGPRAWAEVALGSSALDAAPTTTARVHFASARATAAWRIGRRAKRAWYAEPFATASLIEPDLDVADDLVWEAAIGVNAGQWRRWRLQLQGELRRAGGGQPAGLAGDADLVDREALVLQLGAAF